MSSILISEHVTKQFGGLVAVNKFDFEVPERSIVSIIGPNGAGKTTFFNCVTGFYSFEEGEIVFEERVLNGLSPDRIACRGITRTYQNIRLFANMTALENILVGMEPKLEIGMLGAIFRWLPHGPRTRRGRLLELAALSPLLVPLATLILYAVIWLIGKLFTPSGESLPAFFATLLQIELIAGAVLSGLAVLVGVGLGIWGLVLMGRWIAKEPSFKRWLSGIGLMVVSFLLFNPLNYIFGSRLLAREAGEAENATDEEESAIRRAQELLNFVGLAGKGDLLAKNLPYGDQRRLEIARALAGDPKLLLLDEPTAGMNPRESAEMMDFIRRLRSELGITILLIEHDMRVVMGISERVTVIDYGSKIAEGTPAEIQSNPRVIEAYLGRGAATGLAAAGA